MFEEEDKDEETSRLGVRVSSIGSPGLEETETGAGPSLLVCLPFRTRRESGKPRHSSRTRPPVPRVRGTGRTTNTGETRVRGGPSRVPNSFFFPERTQGTCVGWVLVSAFVDSTPP